MNEMERDYRRFEGLIKFLKEEYPGLDGQKFFRRMLQIKDSDFKEIMLLACHWVTTGGNYEIEVALKMRINAIIEGEELKKTPVPKKSKIGKIFLREDNSL